MVTGGARGCGLAFAQGLAEAGANIAIIDIIEPSPAFESLPTMHKSYVADVSSLPSLRAAFSQFVADFGGKLDICVPCAGINRNVSFLETGEEDFEALMGVNVKGVYYTAQLAAKQMVANGTACGSIVVVASIAAHMAVRSQQSSAYCATKGAVKAMVPAIAKELVGHVGVMSTSPSSEFVRD